METPMTHMRASKTVLSVLAVSTLGLSLQGCVATTVAGAAVGVVGFAAGTTVKVASAAVGTTANVVGAAGKAVTGGSKP